MDKFSEPPSPPARRHAAGTPHTGASPADTDAPSWGPAPWISSVTLLAMLAAVAWRLLDSDPENRVVAAVLVAVFAVVTLLLVRIRTRLRVVAGGIAVTGPLHTRRIDWAQIETIGSARRGRRGSRGRGTTLLELEVRPAPTGAGPHGAGLGTGLGQGDPDDTELITFGRFDLGSHPAEVARTLRRLKNAG